MRKQGIRRIDLCRTVHCLEGLHADFTTEKACIIRVRSCERAKCWNPREMPCTAHSQQQQRNSGTEKSFAVKVTSQRNGKGLAIILVPAGSVRAAASLTATLLALGTEQLVFTASRNWFRKAETDTRAQCCFDYIRFASIVDVRLDANRTLSQRAP